MPNSDHKEYVNEYVIPDKSSLYRMAGFHDDDENCRPLYPSNQKEKYVWSGLFKIGKCLPHTCSEQDVSNGASNFMIDLLGDDILSRGLTLSCHSVEDEIVWLTGDWVMIAVLVFFGILLLIGTLLDIGINILKMEYLPRNIMPIFKGFSIYDNARKILNTGGGSSADSNSLGCINGLKYISISWIVLGHILWEYCNVSGYGAFTNSAVATGTH